MPLAGPVLVTFSDIRTWLICMHLLITSISHGYSKGCLALGKSGKNIDNVFESRAKAENFASSWGNSYSTFKLVKSQGR